MVEDVEIVQTLPGFKWKNLLTKLLTKLLPYFELAQEFGILLVARFVMFSRKRREEWEQAAWNIDTRIHSAQEYAMLV